MFLGLWVSCLRRVFINLPQISFRLLAFMHWAYFLSELIIRTKFSSSNKEACSSLLYIRVIMQVDLNKVCGIPCVPVLNRQGGTIYTKGLYFSGFEFKGRCLSASKKL